MTEARRKNILVLHTDAHVHDCLGIAGHPDVRTPHLDALARDGVWFSNAYACSGVCSPSRAGLITGRYPIAHGVTTLYPSLPSSEPRMGRIFREHGYATGYFGKTHYGGNDADMPGEGWSESFLKNDYNAWLKSVGVKSRYPEGAEIKKKPTRYWTVGTSNIPSEHYYENVLGDRAVDFIRTHARGNFLAFVSFVAPHGPFTPPPPYDSMYDPAKLRLRPRTDAELEGKHPATVKWIRQNQLYSSEADLRTVMALMYGLISLVDDNVGKIVRALREAGVYDDTLIVFASDHGDFLSRYGIFGKSWTMLDEITRIPMIIADPRARGRARRSDALVQNVDILPTLLDYAGIPAPNKVHGRSLAPLLNGSADSVRENVFACDQFEYSGGRCFMSMVRRGHRKYVHSTGFAGELYDLERDPLENHNRIGDPSCAAVVAELRRELLDWHNDCSGGYFDPEKAAFWEDETLFYDASQFCGLRVTKRGDQTKIS